MGQEQKIRNLHKLDVGAAKKTFLTSGSLTGMAILHTDNDINFVSFAWSSDSERIFRIKYLAYLLKKDKIESYSVVTESWFIVRDGVEDVECAPRKASDRKEVIMVGTRGIDGFVMITLIPIERSEDGVSLGEEDRKEGYVSEEDFGRLSRIYEESLTEEEEYLLELVNTSPPHAHA